MRDKLSTGISGVVCTLILCSGALCADLSSQADAGAPTFSHDVAPILYAHCVKCHHAGDIAPMSLLTYKEVRPWAAAIKQAVITRKMPPWKADEHYGEWSNDARLSAAEVSTLKAWVDSQKLEGDAKDMPSPPEFNQGWRIGKPDLVVSIPEHNLEQPERTNTPMWTYQPTSRKTAGWSLRSFGLVIARSFITLTYL